MANWKIDPAHTAIEFKIAHLHVSSLRGFITGAQGTINFDQDDMAQMSFEATVDTKTINTGNPQRDGHLNSPDFFDTAKYPQGMIKSTKVENVNGNTAEVTADLTLKGVTKSVKLEVTFLGTQEKMNQADGSTVLVAAFTATTKIQRNDFNIDFNIDLPGGKFMIGKDVELIIDIEATE